MSQTSRAALIYNLTGQTLPFYPPEAEVRADGAPTADATYSIWRGTDSNDVTAELTGTATLDTVSTTVATTAAGYAQANRRKIILASTTGILAGVPFLLANTYLEREVVVPYEVQTTFVLVENDLAHDYAITTSTFKSLRQVFTIDATFIQTASNINTYGADYETYARHRRPASYASVPPYRVRWRYVTGSTTREAWTYFDVVRQVGKHNVTANDLREIFPDISDREWREQRGQQFAKQIDAAWDLLCIKVRFAGYAIDQLREGPVVDELVRRGALMVIAEAGITPGRRDVDTWVRERRKDWDDMCAAAFGASLHVWIDTGTTGAITTDPPRQMRLRR